MNRALVYSLSGACALYLIDCHVLDYRFCYGPSMLPTIYPHDGVLVDVFSRKWLGRPYKFGDVVMYKSPADHHVVVSKRILGLPGDIVCVDPSVSAVERLYLRVPKGHFWMQGDNFNNSTDSRTYGPVPINLVKGRVFCKFLPQPSFIRNGFDEARHFLSKLRRDQ